MPTEEEKEDERASRFLVDVATSTTQDLYALLGVSGDGNDTASLTENELNRAWKKAALKWHPDKNPGNEKAAADKLDEIRKAFDLLRDPAARRAYEDRRRAKREKVEREQAFDEKRRRMKEDLERRESTGFSPASSTNKRKYDHAETEEERRERDLKRIAAEGARRRAEKGEALREAARQEQRLRRDADGAQQDSGTAHQHQPTTHASGPASSTGTVPEVDRTIKVRWPRDHPDASTLDKERLASIFSAFGPVESVVLLKDKKARPSLGASESNTPDKRHKKQVMATGVVVFASVVGAHAAVLTHSSPITAAATAHAAEWSAIDSVEWASGPPLSLASASTAHAAASSSPATTSTPKRAFNFPGVATAAAATPSTPQDGDGLRRVPSFASFAGSRPGSPAGKGPSLFEITMMRLKEAEKRRLEDAIRKEEGDEAASR